MKIFMFVCEQFGPLRTFIANQLHWSVVEQNICVQGSRWEKSNIRYFACSTIHQMCAQVVRYITITIISVNMSNIFLGSNLVSHFFDVIRRFWSFKNMQGSHATFHPWPLGHGSHIQWERRGGSHRPPHIWYREVIGRHNFAFTNDQCSVTKQLNIGIKSGIIEFCR